MFDAIVVGGRCAGAATALLLARKGLKVLLVDRARFPADIPHGHFIQLQGPRLLKRWGLLDSVVRSGCPAVTTVTTDFGDFPLTGTDVVRDGVAFGYAPRRRVLDAILIDAAIASGVEFRDGFAVDDYSFEDKRITGIRGRSRGVHISERARITVGADGRHSALARRVGAAMYLQTAPLTCWYFSYWSGTGQDGLELYVRDRNAVFAFPTNDGLAAVFVAWEISEFDRVRQDIAASFVNVLERIPHLAQRIRSGKREERFYGTADVPNFFRRPYGPGWTLVGDAGHHKDPFLALGISDAFRDAELLASAIEDGFSGKRPLSDALAGYEQQRNAAAMGFYHENLRGAQFKPVPDDLLAMRAAVRGNPEETKRFYLARQGMIPCEEFFNPDNVRRLLAQAGAGPAKEEPLYEHPRSPAPADAHDVGRS